MIEQDIDHRRHEQGEVDPLARDRGEYGVRIEFLEHVHGPAFINTGSTFVPVTWLIGPTAR